MSTNYDLRKALYNYLDVKFDTNTLIVVPSANNFKTIKVAPGSILNIFISGTKDMIPVSPTSMNLDGLSLSDVNEYYSDSSIKVYWDNDIIYIKNEETTSLKINSIYVEFLEGHLIESYLSSDSSDLSLLTPKITVGVSNRGRINYKDQSLTFKSEYEILIDRHELLKNNYDSWVSKLGKFSKVDKLVKTATPGSKEGSIEDFINNSSINQELLVDNSIEKGKLSSSVQTSLGKADNALQNVTLNTSPTPLVKDSSNLVNINALTKLKIWNLNDNKYEPYSVNNNGEILVSNWADYMQPKLKGATNELLFFNDVNILGKINKNVFLLKGDIIKTEDTTGFTDENVLSSGRVNKEVEGKVDKIATQAIVGASSFIKITINDDGLITNSSPVLKGDLISLIESHYLTQSYMWDSGTGVLKLL